MATTTIHPRPIGLMAPRACATRPVRWLHIAAGAILAAVLIIGLMALAGRALPPHPLWGEPSPGGLIDLADG